MVNNGRLADVMGHVVRSYFVISIFLGDQTLVVLAQYIFSESLTRCSPELSNSCNTKIKVPWEGRMTDLSPSLYLFQYTLLDQHWLSETINMVPCGKEILFNQSRHKQCSSSIDCSGHSITITTLSTSQNFSLKSLQLTSHVSNKFHLFSISYQATWITPGILAPWTFGAKARKATWFVRLLRPERHPGWWRMEDGGWIRGWRMMMMMTVLRMMMMMIIIIIIIMIIIMIIVINHHYYCYDYCHYHHISSLL